jgi:hypothetical protein
MPTAGRLRAGIPSAQCLREGHPGASCPSVRSPSDICPFVGRPSRAHTSVRCPVTGHQAAGCHRAASHKVEGPFQDILVLVVLGLGGGWLGAGCEQEFLCRCVARSRV